MKASKGEVIHYFYYRQWNDIKAWGELGKKIRFMYCKKTKSCCPHQQYQGLPTEKGIMLPGKIYGSIKINLKFSNFLIVKYRWEGRETRNLGEETLAIPSEEWGQLTMDWGLSIWGLYWWGNAIPQHFISWPDFTGDYLEMKTDKAVTIKIYSTILLSQTSEWLQKYSALDGKGF